MSGFSGSRGLRLTKFSDWDDASKLKKDGSNTFKVIRKLKKQLKAEAYSGMASSLDNFPAQLYQVKLPKDKSWLPEDGIEDSGFKVSAAMEEKLKIKVFEDFMDERKARREQDGKIYELLTQQVFSAESLEIIKADPDWKKLDGKESQDDWCGLYNLMIKTHVIQLGGASSEARLIAQNTARYDAYSLKQSSATTSTRHFEDHEDVMLRFQMLGMPINEQEHSFLLINSMYKKASREKREFDIKMGVPLPTRLITTYEYIRHAEKLWTTLDSLNGGSREGKQSVLATEVKPTGAVNSEGKQRNDSGGTSKKKFNKLRRIRYTLEERRAFNALSPEQKAAHKEKQKLDRSKGTKAQGGETTSAGRSVICHKCNQAGHVQRNCPKAAKAEGVRDQIMLIDDDEYDILDSYDDDVGQSHEIFVTTFVETVTPYQDDSRIDENNLFNNKYNYEGIRFAGDSDPELSDDFFDIEEREEILMTEDAAFRNAQRIDDIMLDNKLFRGMRGVRKMPTKEEVELQCDLISHRYLFDNVGGLGGYKVHDLVECNGNLVVKGGPFDVNGLDRKCIIDVWHEYYNSDINVSRTGDDEDNFQSDEKENKLPGVQYEAQVENRAQTKTMTTSHKLKEMKAQRKTTTATKTHKAANKAGAITSTVVASQHGTEGINYKIGQRVLTELGRLSDYNYPPNVVPRFNEDGDEMKPDIPAGSDRSSYLSEPSHDSLHMYNYVPGDTSLLPSPGGSDSNYEPSRPTSPVRDRMITRNAAKGEPRSIVSKIRVGYDGLATGETDADSGDNNFEEAMAEIYEDLDITGETEMGEKKDKRKSLVLLPDRQFAYDLGQDVRDFEVRCEGCNPTNVKQKHKRQKEKLSKKGTSVWYLNEHVIPGLYQIKDKLRAKFSNNLMANFLVS